MTTGIRERRRGREVLEGRLILPSASTIALQGGKVTGWTADRGSVYYVNGIDGVGSDSNPGTDPLYPLLTLTQAISLCTNNYQDVIAVQDYYQPTGETWPIPVNKNQVHIVGIALPGLPYPAIHPPADTAAFQLTSSGQYGSIGRLTIGGGNSHGGIEMGNSGQVDGFDIYECIFGHQWFGTPAYGIYDPSSGTRGGYGCRIIGNKFFGDLGGCKGKISENGISLEPNTDAMAWRDLEIRDNDLLGLAIAINLVRAFDARIHGNRFGVPDAQNGEAITLRAACTGCIVTGNEAMNGMLNGGYTYNPFRDLAANTANHWGRNYRGQSMMEPVGA